MILNTIIENHVDSQHITGINTIEDFDKESQVIKNIIV